ncbi:MAG TPA: M48 family metallopeptidase [Bacillota bacterium]|nr:M48 family metallopeptidase [Bacillota bacterium]
MDKLSIADVRHDGEIWSRILLLLASATLLIFLLLSVVGAIWLAVFLVIEAFLHRLTMAFFRANSVQVSEEQYPDLYRLVVLYSAKLGLKEVPEVYIIQQTILNAFATRVARRNVIVLYSHTVETMLEENSQDALGMVLAHEIGHFAAGHLRWAPFLTGGSIILPPLYLYWTRSCEYTADRLAYLCVENRESAFAGLLKMTVGKRLAPATNEQAFRGQYERVQRDWLVKLSQFWATHPHLINRYFSLKAFAGRSAAVGSTVRRAGE